MSVSEQWKAVIAEGYAVRLVEEGIYSVLSEGPHQHLYDKRAAIYDLVVGTRLYHRVMWGTSMADYGAFARRALVSDDAGMVLDAGCGSLLFTARGYLESQRPIIALDQSLQMLRRARSRLMKLAGSLPDRIFLLQADLGGLPFRPGSFHTAICMNVLHHIAEARSLIEGLEKLLVAGGHLYLTSLVKNDRMIGDQYLDVLYRRGDFVAPRTGAELQELLADAFGKSVRLEMRGNMAFATASSNGVLEA